MKKLFFVGVVVLFIGPAALFFTHRTSRTATLFPVVKIPTVTSPLSPTPAVFLQALPDSKILSNDYHIYQTFNNCGPAALSMALSYYGINVSQQELGNKLRPYQNTQGVNDDKSVTLEEVANEAKNYGLIPYHRPNGDAQLVMQFIAEGMPVVTRTWLTVDEDIGHYRVIKGYDENTKEFIQDDSLQGSNLRYLYDEFDAMWKKFNYEYLVLVPKDKEKIAQAILKEDIDEKKSWEGAVQSARAELAKNPEDMYVRFNLSVALYHVGKYQESVSEFERIENSLPFRTLWYQIEPIEAYYKLSNYEKVFSLTDKILNNHNKAFAELYLFRGDIYREEGNVDAALMEYEKALFYNSNLAQAQEKLNDVRRVD